MPSTSTIKSLKRPEGTLVYDDTEGSGRPVVCIPGMGDLRQSTRFLTPLLVSAGYRVVTMDNRGQGDSSATFSDYSAAAIGTDVVALLTELDLRNAILFGNSMAAGSAVWAAAEVPDRVGALALTGPFVRDTPMPFGVSTLLDMALWRPWGVAFWGFFHKSLFKADHGLPADYADYSAKLLANLREPGRLAVLQKMMGASKAPCELRLQDVRAQAVVMMGSKDPDFPKPEVEGGHVAKALGGSLHMIEGAGHYPHVEFPEQVCEIIKKL